MKRFLSLFNSEFILKKNPKRNLIKNVYFIHVPKNGGTSIAKTIGLEHYTHVKAYELFNSGNQELLKEYFSFGVVRNPFDRFISLYNYARMDRSFYHDNIVEPVNPALPRHLDYELLKNSSINECAQYLMEGLLKHDLEWNQWAPQYTWLYNTRGKKKLVKKIYRFENLEFLKSDLNNLGFQINKLPQLNQSKKVDYKELIDSDTRKKLEKYYKKDLKLFNYSF